MKHPIFESLGNDYPVHLERDFERILIKLEELWEKPEIHDYFSDLLIDKRGGRKGFPKEVMNELILLREFHEFRTFREAEKKEDAIRALGLRGISINGPALLRAINKGDQELVDLFVRSNFNVNLNDESGTPALMVALKKGFTIVAKILIEGGADVNSRDKLGLTPLLIACGNTSYGFRAIAEMLIERGAFINFRDSLGFTPLLLTLSGGNSRIARRLIERGADITVSTRRGETVLDLIRKLPESDAVEVLQAIESRTLKS